MTLGRRAFLIRSAAALAPGWSLWGPASALAQAQGLEFAVKAAFLTRFPAFVSWPGNERPAGEPIRLCVVGEDPVAASLPQGGPAASAGSQPLVVRRLAAIEAPTDCQIVYAAGSPKQGVSQALAAVRGAPVLTVTDASRGPDRGMIHFTVFEDRVRFEIDLRQAAQSGLGISSKLLALALSVKK